MAKQHSPQFLKIANEAQSRVNRCSVEQVSEWLQDSNSDGLDKTVLIDVREESEFAAGHLPNAIPLGKGIIERDIETRVPDSSQKIVLYCGGGFRSAMAADNLQKMGYTNVHSMDGGWSEWNSKGFPTTK